jgi:hypothetical protein
MSKTEAQTMTKTESKPEVNAPQSKITITVRATIPTQQYGNLTLEATQEIFLPEGANAVQRSTFTVSGLELLKRDLALVVLPLAEEEVNRCKSVLIKDDHPDAWLQRNSPLYRWLRVTEPDLEIPAMIDVLKTAAFTSVPH